MQVPSLGQEDPLEKSMATHSSILAWRISWTEEPGRLQSWVTQSRTRLKRLSVVHSKQRIERSEQNQLRRMTQGRVQDELERLDWAQATWGHALSPGRALQTQADRRPLQQLRSGSVSRDDRGEAWDRLRVMGQITGWHSVDVGSRGSMWCWQQNTEWYKRELQVCIGSGLFLDSNKDGAEYTEKQGMGREGGGRGERKLHLTSPGGGHRPPHYLLWCPYLKQWVQPVHESLITYCKLKAACTWQMFT